MTSAVLTRVRGSAAGRGVGRLLGVLDRRFAFHSRGNAIAAVAAVVLFGGWVSLCLGQDANWDLRNYHLYNGYAWLHDRLERDLAPAQMQSYFSPMLDVFQYMLMARWPAPLAGFLMGALHALVFAPLVAIAWICLRGHPQRARLAPLLALAGLCTGAFLSEFGGSMADNTTALPVLGALALVLRAQRRQEEEGGFGAGMWAMAGLMLGTAVAFKLTNAIYAVALAVAASGAGGPMRKRLGGMVLLTLAALAAFALIAGAWYWKLWQVYGNPLLPQFNGFFQAALAQPVSIADTRWRPQGALEHLLWPLLFTFNPWRVSEIALFQCIWAALYVVAVALLVRWLLRRQGTSATPIAALPALVPFFVVAYLLWQGVFGIHRYLVVLELLAPLLLWIACQYALPRRLARVGGGLLVAFCALLSLAGWNDWGHEPWARKGFGVEAPALRDPAGSLVLLVGGEPQAWRVPFLPEQATYASVASNFPEAPAYRERIAVLVAANPERYALLPAQVDKKAQRIERMNAWAARFGWSRQPDCKALRWLVARGLRAELDESRPGQCVLRLRPGTAIDLDAADQALRATAQQQLQGYGLALDEASCRRLSSRIGRTPYPFQWCAAVAAGHP